LLKLQTPSGAEFSSCALAFRGIGMPPQQDPLYAGLGQAVRIGTELLAALIVGGGLGWVVDTYLLGTTPWGLVIGLVLGLVAGMRSAYRSAQRWQSPSEKSK
jgi:ATP synthase protein I